MFGIKDRHRDPYYLWDQPKAQRADYQYTDEKIDYSHSDIDAQGNLTYKTRPRPLKYAQRFALGSYEFMKAHAIVTIVMTSTGYVAYEALNYAFSYLPDIPQIVKGSVYGFGTVGVGITGRKISDFANTRIASGAQYLRERFYI